MTPPSPERRRRSKVGERGGAAHRGAAPHVARRVGVRHSDIFNEIRESSSTCESRCSIRPLSGDRTRTCATGSRSTSGTAAPVRALVSGSPPDPCSRAECSAAGLCGTWPSRSESSESARACRRRRTTSRHARPTRPVPSRRLQSSSSDSSPRYCFVAFRLGMIVFKNTECSSSTNGTKYT
jgi:hypothetical protein